MAVLSWKRSARSTSGTCLINFKRKIWRLLTKATTTTNNIINKPASQKFLSLQHSSQQLKHSPKWSSKRSFHWFLCVCVCFPQTFWGSNLCKQPLIHLPLPCRHDLDLQLWRCHPLRLVHLKNIPTQSTNFLGFQVLVFGFFCVCKSMLIGIDAVWTCLKYNMVDGRWMIWIADDWCLTIVGVFLNVMYINATIPWKALAKGLPTSIVKGSWRQIFRLIVVPGYLYWVGYCIWCCWIAHFGERDVPGIVG